MQIVLATLDEGDIRDLLSLHQRRMLAASPPGASFVLDLAVLAGPDITLLAARGADGALLSVAALKDLGGGAGEVKSMRTADDALRSGVAQQLLVHLRSIARQRGWTLLLLETGTRPEFEAAHRLYRRNGFVPCGPFAGYAASKFNCFYELPV